MRGLVLLALLISVGASAADPPTTTTLYKSVGPDGRVVYGDRPLADARALKTLTFENLPSSPLSPATLAYLEELRKVGNAAAAVAPPPGDVTLFTASWCAYCKKAKAYLASKGTAYREVDIDTKAGAMAYAQAGGQRGVPFLVAREGRVTGFSAAAYDALLLRGGRK